MDTARYKGFTTEEVRLLLEPSGTAVAFRTDSPSIRVLPVYVRPYFGGGTTGFAGRGFDLYIKEDGKWLWAAAGLQNDNALDKPVKLIQDMEEGVKECLLYLPLRSELSSVKVGVEEGRLLEPLQPLPEGCYAFIPVREVQMVRPSVAAFLVDVQGSRNAVGYEGIVVFDAVANGY